jgi:hypothetical protein
MIVWACVVLRAGPRSFLDAAARHLAANIASYRPQAAANVLWGLAKCHHPGGLAAWHAVRKDVVARLSEYSARDVANVCWAFVQFRCGEAGGARSSGWGRVWAPSLSV